MLATGISQSCRYALATPVCIDRQLKLVEADALYTAAVNMASAVEPD
jgi:hypothetical protein